MNENEMDEPDQLRQILSEGPAPFDPDQSLNRVLSRARKQTATRDIVGFFISWIWVLFAGFGASMHQAYVRHQHPVSAKSKFQKSTSARQDQGE